MALRITLYSIAALLLGAHFLRAGNLMMVGLCLLWPMWFFVRLRWSLYLLQLSAYSAAGVWLGAAIGIVELRRQFGQPWLSAAAILGAVSMYTVIAGVVLNARTVRERYP